MKVLHKKLTKELITYVVTETVGEHATPVALYLRKRPKTSEFLISRNVKQKTAFVRNVLYELQTHNIVSYFRKKDKERGWCISYWTLNVTQVKNLSKKIRKQKIETLKERLEKEVENAGNTYICPEFCMRTNTQQAIDNDFTCEYCNKGLRYQDNTPTITEIKKIIQELQ